MNNLLYRKIAAILLIGVFLIAFVMHDKNVYAEDKYNFREFRYMSEQLIPLAKDQQFFVLELDPSVYATMNSSLRDFRLFHDGNELGYTMLPFHNNKQYVQQKKYLEIINNGEFEKGTFSFVLKVPNINDTDLIKLIFDKEPYLITGTLYGSNDNRKWQKLRSVTLFSIDGHTNDLSLSGIDYDYLKIEYKQPLEESIILKEAYLTSVFTENTKESLVEEVPFQAINDEENKEEILIVDLQHLNRLSSEWFFDTDENGFNRQVITEASNTKDNWEKVGSTYIYSYPEGERELSFQYGPVNKRYLRIRILNNDNAPIEVDTVKVRTYPVRVLVKVPSTLESTTVKLLAYWGNATVESPSYDVEKLLEFIEVDQYPVFKLTDKKENPDYKPLENSLPITERYQFLLPVFLIFAALIVAVILYRNLKQIKN